MGEIFDRAVALFVRRFGVLAGIVAIVAIPVAFVQYAVEPAPAGIAGDVQKLLTLPAVSNQDRLAILRLIVGVGPVTARDIELDLMNTIMGVLATTACVIGVAHASAGEQPSVRVAYREALRRWAAQVAAGAMLAGCFSLVTAGLLIVILVCSLPLGAIASLSPAAATIVSVSGAIAVGLTFAGAVIGLNFVAQMTIVSIALEDARPMRGIARAARRTLSRTLLWRSAQAATVVWFVSWIGSLMMDGIGEGLRSLTNVAAVFPVISAGGDIALTALTSAFVVMYSLDVRIRREGYDLSLAAQAASL